MFRNQLDTVTRDCYTHTHTSYVIKYVVRSSRDVRKPTETIFGMRTHAVRALVDTVSNMFPRIPIRPLSERDYAGGPRDKIPNRFY